MMTPQIKDLIGTTITGSALYLNLTTWLTDGHTYINMVLTIIISLMSIYYLFYKIKNERFINDRNNKKKPPSES